MAAFLLVAALASVAYLPSFSVPFQFDDWGRIVGNEALQDGRYWDAIGWLGGSRVIPSATLALNHWWGGDETFGYHAVNLAVHLLATLGVFLLALALCRTPRLRDTWADRRDLLLATTASFLFACHPLQSQAVTYIIQRAAAMATAFYVWTVLLFVWARNRPPGRGRTKLLAGAALLALGAVLSKENAATVPLAILLTELTFYGAERAKLRRIAPFAAAGLAFLAVPIGWRLWIWQPRPNDSASILHRLGRALLDQGDVGTAVPSPFEYLVTQWTVLPRYLRLLIFPFGLNVDHDVAVQHGPTPAAVAGLAFLTALAAVGFVAVRRRPLLGYGILWFFVAMSVESSFVPILDTMMEHRVYLAMPGLALLLAALFVGLLASWRRLGVALALVLVCLLPALTFARNLVWQSPLALWSDALRNSPDKARVHVNLGVAYHGLHRYEEAIRHYCRAIDLDPHIAIARENLEIALEEEGRLDAAMDRAMSEGQVVRRRPDGSFFVEYDLAAVVCPATPLPDQARAD